MKILLVSPLPPPVGGIATITANLVSYCKNNIHGISLILLNTSHKYRGVTSESMIERLLTGFFNSVKTYFKVRKIVKKEKPQIIHLSSSSSFALIKDYLIISFAKKKKIPVVMHWHFGRIPNLSFQKNWEWKLLCHVIYRSTWSIVIDSKSYDTLYNIGYRNISNIPNPLSLEMEKRSMELLRNMNQRIKDRLIFVGHIIRNKGVYELVEVCSSIPTIKELLLVGPYEEAVHKELLKLSTRRDNGTWLKFIGTLDEVHVLELMQNSSLLALPSYTEGFPIVVIEAMAMGCAVIATEVGAIPEMLAVKSNVPCGVCVKVRNVTELKDAIIKLTKDPDKTETMGKNGIVRVLNNYTLEKVVEQYKTIWKNVSIIESPYKVSNLKS